MIPLELESSLDLVKFSISLSMTTWSVLQILSFRFCCSEFHATVANFVVENKLRIIMDMGLSCDEQDDDGCNRPYLKFE
jgi:hypothetical protein